MTSLRILQDSSYMNDDWWRWSVWIDGVEADLDRIDRVVYTLHPTFPDPVRTVTDRASKFKIETAGWGVFKIRAKVQFKDGKTERLTHDLELHYPDGRATMA